MPIAEYEPNRGFDWSRCVGCDRPMELQGSCRLDTVTIEAQDHRRIPFGQESTFPNGDEYFFDPACPSCADCRAAVGGVHHVNCDHEECPRCHGMMLMCACPKWGKPGYGGFPPPGHRNNLAAP